MFHTFGTPEPLRSIGQESIDMAEAKRQVEIAVLDDNPFAPKEALLHHKFRITELGPDIRSLDQVATFPIIVCDVAGVGRAFGSSLEGAHLVNEIRKAYPDKFLIGYTGQTHSVATTNALTAADRRMAKDESIEAWIKNLEAGMSEVMNPRNRWVRMRRALLERGIELFDVFKLEQAFIKAVRQGKPDVLANEARNLGIAQEIKDLVIKFSATAVAALIGASLGI
ncbi:hypothetical protein GCM10027019_07270 [Melaminivora jejuensis]|uniref:hypothetical protein n=1 Tax=Melaminivora jejuensis TaxID=1267217 RepID=UPI001AE02C0D|nr:hypothetical protein [Melaminivora jejuensis]UHJ66513.1 hypothetical protein LVC68_08480 [Melaminivora jejuensis]